MIVFPNQRPGMLEPRVVIFEVVRDRTAPDSRSGDEKIATPPNKSTFVSQFLKYAF
jgi:hypothetical protein